MDFNRSDTNLNPLIMDFKGNSLDDGPGIRSVVFFKGCNLDCVWCHNPESKSTMPELLYEAEKCIGCLECASVCPPKAISFDKVLEINRITCNHCFKCVDVCSSTALQKIGKFYTVQEICDQILPYEKFFKTSQGGVTISGGEATIHLPFLHQLLEQLKCYNLHILLETNGLFNYRQFCEYILPFIDLIYMDIKLMDSKEHSKFCGHKNAKILDNFQKLYEQSKTSPFTIIPRIPLIPDITDTESNLIALRKYLETLGVPVLYLLSNNAIWFSKCEKFGYKRPFTPEHSIYQIYSDPRKARVKKIFETSSIEIHLS